MRISDWSSDVCSSDLLPTATPLGLAYQAAAMAGWSSAAMLPMLRNVPTLILMGERDGVVPACHGQTIAELIDGAELEVVPGSHLFPFTHAAAVAVRISGVRSEERRGGKEGVGP